MAVYPNAFWGGNTRGANLNDAHTHTKWHDDIQAEVIAMQAENGLQPKGTFASVRARLDNLSTIRYRQTRIATNYATGDQPIAGTVTTVENTGTFTGSMTSAAPLVVPVSGTYLITGWFISPTAIAATNPPSAIIFTVNGAARIIPMQPGTTVRIGATIEEYLAASGQIYVQLRNLHGATLNGVSWQGQVCRIPGST